MLTRLIENFITKSECNHLIELGKSKGLEKMVSSRFVKGELVETGLNYHGNKRRGCYFIGDDNDDTIKSISLRTVNILNDIKPLNSIIFTEITKYSFNEYSEGDFLDWHEDKHEILNGATLTCIFQLNDNYSGGEISYMIGNKEFNIEPKVGSLFVFDSNITHSVNKIVKGQRYSLNAWPKSKKGTSLI